MSCSTSLCDRQAHGAEGDLLQESTECGTRGGIGPGVHQRGLRCGIHLTTVPRQADTRIHQARSSHDSASGHFRKVSRVSEFLGAGPQNYAGQGIIAEGIEIDEELEVVRSMGVSLAQGFLLDRPNPLPSSSRRKSETSQRRRTSRSRKATEGRSGLAVRPSRQSLSPGERGRRTIRRRPCGEDVRSRTARRPPPRPPQAPEPPRAGTLPSRTPPHPK